MNMLTVAPTNVGMVLVAIILMVITARKCRCSAVLFSSSRDLLQVAIYTLHMNFIDTHRVETATCPNPQEKGYQAQ